jgi:hypothetical protein
LSEPPPAGTVFRYAYLWADERDRGQEEGTKLRPSLVVAVVLSQSRVIAVAITHSPPDSKTDAVALPDAVKRSLGLDDRPSWIVVTEANVFNWPGPDLWNIEGTNPPTSIYGRIPPKLLQTVAQRLLDNDKRSRMRRVMRTE